MIRDDVLTLYQLPISHYCEKVRWALDYKQLHYKTVNLLVGLHVRPALKLSGKSSLPILQHGQRVVRNSSDILDYLDSLQPAFPLLPTTPEEQAACREWERWLDAELGDDVRRFLYHTLLDHRGVVLPFFTHGGPWYGPWLLRAMYPKLQVRMRRFMKIDASSAERSRVRMETALVRLAEAYAQRRWLVGDRFTRADLTAAALAAPLIMPEAYGLPWPERLPEPLHSWHAAHAAELDWARRLYRECR